MRDASRDLAQVLPYVRVEQIAGQGHFALRNVPELVARLIHDFLSGSNSAPGPLPLS
jgi:pimeloyl-ACP methyl ester carboxylesterase